MYAAPAVRTRLKARHSEGDEARALLRAMSVWRDTPLWIPVVWGRKLIAHVKGDPVNRRVHVWFGRDLPYADYDDAILKKSAGKHWGTYWCKPTSTSMVIDSWYDLWGSIGNPQSGDWSGTARTARQFTNTTTGSMWTGAAVSPSKKYVTRASQFNTEATVQSTLLYDRVLSYDKCTMTASSQNMTNTLPATRYASIGSPGLQIFIEADAIHNGTAANLNVLNYTDQDGNGPNPVPTSPTLAKIVSVAAPTTTLGARCVIQTPGVATKSGNPYLTLANQSTSSSGGAQQGVRAILNYTWSAAPTGTVSFVLQFPLALFPDVVTVGAASDYEFVSGIEAINKRIYDDACLCFLICPHVTAQPSNQHGWLEFGWT